MVPYTLSSLAQATILKPSGAEVRMTMHSKAPNTMIGNRGALCTESAPVIAMTWALSTFFLKKSPPAERIVWPQAAACLHPEHG